MNKRLVTTTSEAGPGADHFFSIPGARVHGWRDLHALARNRARGSGNGEAVRTAFAALAGLDAAGFAALAQRISTVNQYEVARQMRDER
jgi:hypothetical protein